MLTIPVLSDTWFQTPRSDEVINSQGGVHPLAMLLIFYIGRSIWNQNLILVPCTTKVKRKQGSNIDQWDHLRTELRSSQQLLTPAGPGELLEINSEPIGVLPPLPSYTTSI